MPKFDDYLRDSIKRRKAHEGELTADFIAFRNLVVLMVDIEFRRKNQQTLDRRGGRGYHAITDGAKEA